MNPAAKPDSECRCCPGNGQECCDCCYVRQNHICFTVSGPICCVLWIFLFVVIVNIDAALGGMVAVFVWPTCIIFSIASCCCLCFCRQKQAPPPPPTVSNAQYVQQQPVVQYVQQQPPAHQYVQPVPQRYVPVSHAVVQPQQYQTQYQQPTAKAYFTQPPPPPQPTAPPPPAYVAQATVVEVAPQGAHVLTVQPEEETPASEETPPPPTMAHPTESNVAPIALHRGEWDANGLVAALRRAPHMSSAVISHCMRHIEGKPTPSDFALVFDSLALSTQAVEVADALAKNVDVSAEMAVAAVNAAPSLSRADVANKFERRFSGAARAQLVAGVPGLTPRRGGGFEYF